ncbi:MAG: hypothetical protein QF792_01110 [Phycisphaerae bacterium]|jgi:hypothetical protein|nr:hypothetical protein [Phycisphaerae bacterium]
MMAEIVVLREMVLMHVQSYDSCERSALHQGASSLSGVLVFGKNTVRFNDMTT